MYYIGISDLFVVIWISDYFEIIISKNHRICQNQNSTIFLQQDYFMVSKLRMKLVAASNEGGFIWFNFYQPPKEELTSLVDTIGIHPLSVEDCLDDKPGSED